MANFDPLDLAYAAGIIDGEGYIGITVREPTGRSKSPVFQCVVNVGMADAEIPLWLREKFGGAVYSYEPGRYGTRLGVHHWRLAATGAEEFCSLVRPYLRLKHRQAGLLIEYRRDSRLDHGRHGGRGVRVPETELSIKREYAAEIRALNQREVPAGGVV